MKNYINLIISILVLFTGCKNIILFEQDDDIVLFKNFNQLNYSDVLAGMENVEWRDDTIFGNIYPDTLKMYKIALNDKKYFDEILLEVWNDYIKATSGESFLLRNSSSYKDSQYYVYGKINLQPEVTSYLIWQSLYGGAFDPNWYWNLWLVNVNSGFLRSIISLSYAADVERNLYSPIKQTYFDNPVFTHFNPHLYNVDKGELNNKPYRMFFKKYFKKIYSSYVIDENGYLIFVENEDIGNKMF